MVNRLTASTTVLLICVLGSVNVSLGDDFLKSNTSLKFTPDSVGFYASFLNTGQQWKEFQKTNAYQRIKELPYVQAGLTAMREKWEAPDDDSMEEFKEFIADNPSLVGLFWEMLSEDIFVFGDASFGELLGQLNRFNDRNQLRSLEELGAETDEGSVQDAIIDDMIDEVSKMAVPQFAIGFRIKDRDTANEALDRLEEAIQEEDEDADEDGPEVELKRLRYDDSTFLQVTLDSSMIDWDEVNEDGELNESQMEKLQASLTGRTVSISFGVHDGYVLFVVGPTAEPLAAFSKDGLLIDRDEMARARKLDDGRTFTQLAYMDDTFAAAISRPHQQMDQLNQVVSLLLPLASLPDDLTEEMESDVRDLVEDLKEMIPEPGKTVMVNYQIDDGYAGYTQRWVENLHLDGSKKLDILQHLGGQPIMAFATRYKSYTPGYDFLAKWSGRTGNYVNRLMMEHEKAEEFRGLYSTFRDKFWPFVQRYHEIGRNQMLPTMEEDRQAAWILSAGLDPQKQWHIMMPPSEDDLPMFEFAKVFGIGSADDVEKADEQMAELSDDLLADLKEFTAEHDEEIREDFEGAGEKALPMLQNFQWPERTTKEVDEGKIISYDFLTRMGLNAQIAPTRAWSDDYFVSTWSPSTAERIMKTSEITKPLAAHADQALASAAVINFKKLFQAVRPWVSYGMMMAVQNSDEDISELWPQVESTFDILECYESASFITFEEDDSMVTYSEAILTDIE